MSIEIHVDEALKQRLTRFSPTRNNVRFLPVTATYTVLQSKRVELVYVLQCLLQTCMSRVIICYSVFPRIGLYISENMDCNHL